MIYRIFAEIVLGIHFLFILYVVLGALLVVKWRWTAWMHIPAMAWGALIMFAGWICPLTPLENELRIRAGAGRDAGGFIEYYIWPLIYPEALTREIQIYLGIGVIIINTALYGFVVFRRRLNAPRSG